MTFARPQTHHVEVDGVRIGYQVFGSGITLERRGTHALKGISEPCELYRVTDVAL